MNTKKVLFIGIGFYDYEDAIINEFKKNNYKVEYYCETPNNDLKNRFYHRIKNEKRLQQINKKHVLNIANDCGEDYDLVFIIKCEYLTSEALNIIKNKNPKSLFVLYLWDSIKRIKNIESKFNFFDRIYSFDRKDTLNVERLNFNPLFFREEYLNHVSNKQSEFSLYHLGWYHSDRLILIKEIADFCKKNDITYKFLLFTGFFNYLIQLVFGGELRGNKSFLIFKPISASANRTNILKSEVILDIAHPDQSGLTMRTIELIGMQKKIITTNEDIVNYDFYHPNNILIVDRKNIKIDKNFFLLPYVSVSREIVNKYSISNWLKKML